MHAKKSDLVDLCRAIRHGVDAGMMLSAVFRQQARRGPLTLRPVCQRLAEKLERGQDLNSALIDEEGVFPPLFVNLLSVGEKSGHLPEVCQSLEDYYRDQLRLRRQFLSQITLPVVQLILAVLVIAALIFVLGLIADSNQMAPLDPLGLGLTGTKGALLFLLLTFGAVVVLAVGYRFVRRYFSKRANVDAFLLQLPFVGPFFESLALARFCLSMNLLLETAAPLHEAVKASMIATDNTAFMADASIVAAGVRSGRRLAASLEKSDLFPDEFRSMVEVAEEAGQLPEMFRRLFKKHEELASHRLAILTRLAGFAVWLITAILIVVAIIRIYMTMYLQPLQRML
ncbi:MAG: hypothetical protein KatS3mg105_0353 [Gemmatales bacterium]|nr:MAG: hypothetical protein KatS3mg105_0353 [Gemmatales bacterium]